MRATSSNIAMLSLSSDCIGDNKKLMGFCNLGTFEGAVRQTGKPTCSSLLQQHTNNVERLLKEFCNALLKMAYRCRSIEVPSGLKQR